MVDRDSIEGRLNDGGDDDSGDDSSSGGSSGSGTVETVERKSKKTQIEEFKKGTGISSADTSKGTTVPMSDAEDVLKSIANMVLYAEGTLRALDEPSNAREKKKKEIAEIAYNQITDIVSEKKVQRICEKYGIDWQDDIIEDVLKNQDYDRMVGL